MATFRTEEFRRDAVQTALFCGLPCKKIADDLGGGMPTLIKGITANLLLSDGLLVKR